MSGKNGHAWVGIVLTLVMLVTGGCGTRSNSVGPAPKAGGENPAVGAGTGAPSSGGGGNGNVSILGAFTGTEAQAFNAVLQDFMAQNPNIKVTYSGTNQFETLILVRVAGGDVPDIGAFPQPGAVARFARAGNLVPLWDAAIKDYDQNYSPAWKELGSVDGKVYGTFHRVNAKGFIWYNKSEWDKAGWQTPKTWNDLMTLAEQMQSQGTAPFCDGIQAGASTGWKGTDWIESIILRTQPLNVYNDWASGKLKFNSDQVKNAFNLLGTVWSDPKMVYGGSQTVATSDVPAPATWMFDDPPKCWMHFEGSFVVNFFPDAVRKNLDQQVGFFLMPSIDPNISNPPLEVGGDEYVVFKGHDRPEVKKFIEWLGTPAAAKAWAKQGGALFAYKNQDISVYPTKIEQGLAQQIVNAQSVVFDASDSMPSKENLAFWKGVTDWVSGNRTLDQALQQIDAGSQ